MGLWVHVKHHTLIPTTHETIDHIAAHLTQANDTPELHAHHLQGTMASPKHQMKQAGFFANLLLLLLLMPLVSFLFNVPSMRQQSSIS